MPVLATPVIVQGLYRCYPLLLVSNVGAYVGRVGYDMPDSLTLPCAALLCRHPGLVQTLGYLRCRRTGLISGLSSSLYPLCLPLRDCGRSISLL